jgi:capsular polysaccharide biosynthesis protein
MINARHITQTTIYVYMTKNQKISILILASVFSGACIGFAASLFQKPYTEASRSFVVQNERHTASSQYDYEGYYTLQTADEAAKALVSWLSSPGGVSEIYQASSVDGQFRNLGNYEKAFNVRRADSPFFEVRYKSRNQDEAARISDALDKLLRQELKSFQNSNSLSLGSATVVLAVRPTPYASNMLYGGLLAGALAIFAILFKKAMESGL